MIELASDWRVDLWEMAVNAEEWERWGRSEEERWAVATKVLTRAAAHSGYVNPVVSLVEHHLSGCDYSVFTVTAERPITDGPAA